MQTTLPTSKSVSILSLLYKRKNAGGTDKKLDTSTCAGKKITLKKKKYFEKKVASKK